jgi:membrane protease YdiL (CAAX protease family)
VSDRTERTTTPASNSDAIHESASTAAAPATRGRWIFLGPQGLRAGWSILIFAALCAILIIGAQIFVGPLLHVNLNAPIGPLKGLAMELCQFVPVVVATWVMARLERRPLLFYGYQGSARAVRFISGIVWGFLAISVLVLALHHFGYLLLEGRTLHGEVALKYAGLWGVVFICVGFTEESLLRGYAQFTITRGIGFWWGMILLALLFGLMHRTNPGESPVGLASVVGAGLIFCLSLWFTGSLWWAVGFHAAWDWGQSYFYGTADSGMLAQGHLFREHPVGSALWSGGTTGPEGSVLVLPFLLVVGLLMALWWGRKGKSPFAGAAWRPIEFQTGQSEEGSVLRIAGQ